MFCGSETVEVSRGEAENLEHSRLSAVQSPVFTYGARELFCYLPVLVNNALLHCALMSSTRDMLSTNDN